MAVLWLSVALILTGVDARLGPADAEILGVDGLIGAIFDQTRQRGFDLNHDRGVSAADVTALIQLNDHLP